MPKKSHKLSCNCRQCGKQFLIYPCQLKKGGGLYCSRQCATRSRIGIKLTEEHKSKISKSHLGKIPSENIRKKISTTLINREKVPTIVRFISKVKIVPDGCWEWIGPLKPGGYGIFTCSIEGNKKTYNAHRFSWECFRGSIPKDLTIDHLCKNRKCMNPSHMEVVTIKENVLRGDSSPAKNARKTHCAKGHPLEIAPWLSKGKQLRWCRICAREKAYEWRKNNPEKYKESKMKSYIKQKHLNPGKGAK